METLSGRTLLNRYFLRELVGSGGMADVYLAWDQLRNAKMAVKVLRRDLGSNTLFFDRFANEAEILRKLEHPNIVRLFEFEREDEIAFIVMQWVEGSNLRQILNKTHRILSLEDCSRILGSVCSALHYAHENKIFHCDIKPANIMLDIKGKTFDTLLTDFGVAQLADNFVGGGTPTYMAPEQFTGGEIDARTDVYALGVSLYEILSGGNTPYKGLAPHSEGSTTKERIAWEHLYSPPPSLTSVNPNCSVAMERVVLTAMQKNPQSRFPSAMSFLNAFEQARSTMLSETMPANYDIRSLISQFSQQTISATSTILDKFFRNEALEQRQIPVEHNEISKANDSTNWKGPQTTTGLNVLGRNHFIYCRSGLYAGQRLPIHMGETAIGRGKPVQLKLNEATVSRRHATIIRTTRGVYIRDDGSTMGTFVNGTRISRTTQLKAGDIIQIGSQQIFEYTKG